MSTSLYYLGPEETFSHRAASHMAAPGEQLCPCEDFRAIFSATDRDPTAAAIVPFENTTGGSVTEVMDLLAQYTNLIAVECRKVPVHQHLLTCDMTTPVERILSKAEALAQCRETLRRIYPGVPQEAVSSTAEAARMVQSHPTWAAVAGESTAARYGLVLRRNDVQDVSDNSTRFFKLVHRTGTIVPNACACAAAHRLPPTHALLYVTLDDTPGSLLTALETLKGLNLTFIQSRPIHGSAWQYGFFVELLIGTSSKPLGAVITQLSAVARGVHLLGSYTITTQPTQTQDNTTLSNLRDMIATLDATLVAAFGKRADFHLNPDLYVHSDPVTHDELARAMAYGDATERTRSLRKFYLQTILPALSTEGQDANPREALHADANVMAALAQRFSFATKVIARKRVEMAPELREAAQTRDPAKVENALLNAAVEAKVLARAASNCKNEGANAEQTERVIALYRDHLLPVSRLIQVYVVLSAND